jgi:TRAP-type C4-dicarboxylate transport system substrate-binding protein
MKKVSVSIAVAVLSLLGTARAHAEDAPPVAIRVATPFAEGHILAVTAHKFKELLEANSPGQFQVTVSTSVLNEQKIDPAAQSCDPSVRVADIIVTGGQPIQDYAPAYYFMNGPYVMRDFDHFQKVWRSDLGEATRDLLKTNGNFVSFDPVYRGFRHFTSNKVINEPADFASLKLRLPPIPDWIAVWSTLVPPAQIVQVPLNDLYAALQSGKVDSSEGDLTQITSLKLYQVQSQLTLTSHLVGFGLPLANRCFYENVLSGDQRERVREAMNDASLFGTQTFVTEEPNLLNQLGALMTVNRTPDAAAIRAAVKPAVDNLFATKWTVTTWDAVLKLDADK